MPLPDCWDRHRRLIEQWLDDYFAARDGCPERLREALRYSLLSGGKRLRPVLTLIACEVCGGSAADALPQAAAVEMIHTYSLIHDDLPAMDDDDLRRGRPTCHKAFDEATAILAGDALLTEAFVCLTSEVDDARVSAGCCRDLAEASGMVGMVGGQMDDLLGEQIVIPEAPSESERSSLFERLKSIHARKTGRLITASLTLGGRAARATAEELARLDAFGRCVGLTFQIADDLLDILGDEQRMGKGVRKDATHGKLTYPGLLGIDNSQELARTLTEKAIGCLDAFGTSADPLRQVARFIIERDH